MQLASYLWVHNDNLHAMGPVPCPEGGELPHLPVGVIAGCLPGCRDGGWLLLVFIAWPPALAPDLCWGALLGMEDISPPPPFPCMHVIRR